MSDRREPVRSLDLRLATVEDARRVAEVHVRARRAAYQGLVSAPLLVAESLDERERRWTKRLSDPEGRCWILSDESELFGFAYTARPMDHGLEPDSAELYSIYLVREATRRGFGRALVTHAVEDLRARGFVEVVLWYAVENVGAARFYAAVGFERDPRASVVGFGDTGLTKERLRRRL